MANTDKDATYTLGRELCEIIISHLRGNKDERKSITEQSKEIREFFEKVTLEQKIDILSHSYGWTPSDSNI